MLAVVDIGNTNTVFCFFEDHNLLLQTRIKTDYNITEDEIFAFLDPILRHSQLTLSKFTSAAISCVVPLVLKVIERFFVKYCNITTPLIVSSENHNVLVNNKPAPHLGSDLVVNAIAAANIIKKDCLIIDFGTATTFALLEYHPSKVNYIGIAIAPGLNSLLLTLKNSTAQLPYLNFQKTNTILGTTTKSAMLAGSYFGFIGMVEKIIDTISLEYNKKFKIIITGGLSKLIKEEIPKIDLVEPNLTLLGLKYFYLLNKSV